MVAPTEDANAASSLLVCDGDNVLLTADVVGDVGAAVVIVVVIVVVAPGKAGKAVESNSKL